MGLTFTALPMSVQNLATETRGACLLLLGYELSELRKELVLLEGFQIFHSDFFPSVDGVSSPEATVEEGATLDTTGSTNIHRDLPSDTTPLRRER